MIAFEDTAHSKSWIKWLCLYLILCLSYLVFINTQYSLHFFHKAAAILMLLMPVATLMSAQGRTALWLAIVLSAIGDMLLASRLPMQFELGLGAFLLAHLAYLAVMWPTVSMQSTDRLPAVLMTLVFIALCSWILPFTGQMLLPVAVYMSVICAMAFCALLSKPRNFVLLSGAILFVISDSIIAINKFIVSLPEASLVIMVTYYSAQFLLVFSLINQVNRRCFH